MYAWCFGFHWPIYSNLSSLYMVFHVGFVNLRVPFCCCVFCCCFFFVSLFCRQFLFRQYLGIVYVL